MSKEKEQVGYWQLEGALNFSRVENLRQRTAGVRKGILKSCVEMLDCQNTQV